MEASAGAHTGGRHSTRATSTVTETESLLSKLGQGYKRAKAQQILRLLADQESLNQRFKDCALNEDDDDEEGESTPENTEKTRKDSTDARSNSPIGGVWVKRGLTSTLTIAEEEKRERKLLELEKEQRREGYLGGSKIKTVENTAAKPKQKKKVSSAVDPSRCRTSMGFYNAAECSTSIDGHLELDVEAAANADLELAMGAEADTENQSPRFLNETNDFVITAVGARARLTPRGGPKQRRLFRQQITQGVTSTVTDTIPEESVGIQSARSSSTRPKTGIVGSSARSKQYRRPSRPNPTNDEIENSGNALNHRGFGQPEYTPTSILSNITTTSTTVSKLDPPFTPRGGNVGGIGVRGFCEGPQTPRVSIRDDAIFIPITPRGGSTSITPRPEASYAHGVTSAHRHSNEPISALFTPRQQQDYSGSATPRGNGSNTAQDITTPSNTPRDMVVDSSKGLYTPRHSNGGGGAYSSRVNESKPSISIRPSKTISFRTNDLTQSHSRKDPSSSPRRNELALALTPRQKDHNGVAFTPRNESTSGLYEICLTPRNDISPSNPLKTPRRGEEGGTTSGVIVTPRSYNMTSTGQWAARPGASGTGLAATSFSTSATNEGNLKQSKLSEQTTLNLNSPRTTYPIPEYIKSEGWSSTCTTGIGINGDTISPRKLDSSGQVFADSQRSPRHVSRAVLSVEKNPSHVVSTTMSHRHSKGRAGQSEVEMTTPRRQRVVAAAVAASEKTAAAAASSVMTPRGCGDLHRVPVHTNLSHRSERMQPMAVMKLPPLDAAIHKPVVS